MPQTFSFEELTAAPNAAPDGARYVSPDVQAGRDLERLRVVRDEFDNATDDSVRAALGRELERVAPGASAPDFKVGSAAPAVKTKTFSFDEIMGQGQALPPGVTPSSAGAGRDAAGGPRMAEEAVQRAKPRQRGGLAGEGAAPFVGQGNQSTFERAPQAMPEPMSSGAQALRTQLETLPVEQRYEATQSLAQRPNGEAARELLQQVERENAPYAGKDADERRAAAMLAARRQPLTMGPGQQREALTIPDTRPGIVDVAEGRGADAARIGERRSVAAGVQQGRRDEFVDQPGRAAGLAAVQAENATATRRQFARDHENIAALASGSGQVLSGVLNAPAVAGDFFNRAAVNPVLNAAGQPSLPRVANIPGVEAIQRAANEINPLVARMDMGEAWDDGLFSRWLMTNMAAQAPQMAQSLVAAMAPPLRATMLGAMGAQSAGNSFAQGDSSYGAATKGLIEAGSEMLPLHVFDKAKAAILALPSSARGGVVGEAVKRLGAAGAAITASSLTEAIEEGAAQIGQNLTDTYVEGKPTLAMKGVGGAMVLGGAMGGAMGGPNVASALRGDTERKVAEREMARAIDGTNLRAPNSAGATNPNLRPTEQRKAVFDTFDDDVATHGMSPAAAKAIKAQAETKTLAELPGFIQRAKAALAKRGLFRGPVDEAAPTPNANTTPSDGSQQNAPDAANIPGDGTGLADRVASRLGIDPAEQQARTPVDDAAHQAATSPENDLAEPTQGQKEAGNYKVGRARIAGLDLSIENPEGSVRRGVDADGTPWENKIRGAHYGYVRGSEAKDGDHVDAFIKAGTAEDYSGPVFVVDQIDPKTGRYDEAKAIIGAASQEEAEAIYRSNYAPDWQGLGAITSMPIGAFKAWAVSKEAKKPLGGIANATTRTASDAGPGLDSTGRGDGSAGVLGGRADVAVDAGATDAAPVLGVRADAVRPATDTARNPTLNTPAAGLAATQEARNETQSTQDTTPAAETAKAPVLGPPDAVWNGMAGQGISNAIGARQQIPSANKKHPGLTWVAVPAPEFGDGKFKLEGRKSADVAEAARPIGTEALPGEAATSPVVGKARQVSQDRSVPRKVYQTRTAANAARTGNTQKLQKVKNGFILREMTDGEIDAAAKLAERAKRGKVSDPTKDDMGLALAKSGGLNRESASRDLGVHKDYFKTMPRPGMPLFPRAGGMNAERAVEAMVEDGYLLPGSGLSDLEDKLGEHLGGNTQYSMRRDYSAEAPLADLTAEAVEDAGYMAASPQVQEITDQLIAEAEALGIDTDGIREDATKQIDPDAPQDTYLERVQEALRQAIATAQAPAPTSDAAAARASGADRGEVAGGEGQEGLTGPTADSLRADAERAQSAEKADAAEQKRLTREAAKAREQAELSDRTRQDAGADAFQLGQSRADVAAAMAGNGDLFAQPAEAPAAAQAIEPGDIVRVTTGPLKGAILTALRPASDGAPGWVVDTSSGEKTVVGAEFYRRPEAANKVGDMVKFTKPGLNGPINQAGRIERILPDGRLEIRSQEGGIYKLRSDELGHRPKPARSADTQREVELRKRVGALEMLANCLKG